MYDFTNLTEVQILMIGTIVSNEVKRAERSLKNEVDNLEYQREYIHIFLKDGTINQTEKKIISRESRVLAAKSLLAAITIK